MTLREIKDVSVETLNKCLSWKGLYADLSIAYCINTLM